MPKRPDGKHPGFAFVEVPSAEASEAVVSALNEQKVCGRIVAADVAQNRTIPTGTALSFTNGGAFVVAAGVTLTINGSLTAPAQHIFDGPGRVRFAPDSAVDRVLPQWFGAKPGGSADCTLAVQRAIESI